jgi:hypothetical protein
MTNGLTAKQRNVADWLREQCLAGTVGEELSVVWRLRDYKPTTGTIEGFKGKHPELHFSTLLVLEDAGFLLTTHKEERPAQARNTKKVRGMETFSYTWPRHEIGRSFAIQGGLFNRKYDSPTNAFDSIPLEAEQLELLRSLVEAARNMARTDRQKFIVSSTFTETQVLHQGLPGGYLVAYAGDIDILANAGLLLISDRGQPGRSFDVAPRGFAYYENVAQEHVRPLQQVEEQILQYLDSAGFSKRHVTAYKKWFDAQKLLWASDSQDQLTTVGHMCREAMQEFAESLLVGRNPANLDSNKAHDVSRISSVLRDHSSELGTAEIAFLDSLIAYWGVVSDLAQRQEHGAQKEGRPLIWEDARRLVFQTAIVMYEVRRAVGA